MTQNAKEQGKDKGIAVLIKTRGMELQAIAPYMNQHYSGRGIG